MNAAEYCSDPCGASSLPFWKTERPELPPGVSVWREDDRSGSGGERYFKLVHSLKRVPPAPLPARFAPAACGIEAFAAHINGCYAALGVTAEELRACTRRPVYDPALWVALRDAETGLVAASGIGELDARIGEGILEWIQVSPGCRRLGLGRWLVCELLRRMQGKAAFVTVSGRLDDPCDPLALYRACGFEKPVIWRVVRP